MDDMKTLIVRVPADLARRFKAQAALHDTTMQKLLTEVVENFCEAAETGQKN